MTHVIVWRYMDGSAFGVVASFSDEATAKWLLKLLNEFGDTAKDFELRSIEPVPDSVRPIPLPAFEELKLWARRAIPYLANHCASTPMTGLDDDVGDRIVMDKLAELTK